MGAVPQSATVQHPALATQGLLVLPQSFWPDGQTQVLPLQV
jgi:hypothetical protein